MKWRKFYSRTFNTAVLSPATTSRQQAQRSDLCVIWTGQRHAEACADGSHALTAGGRSFKASWQDTRKSELVVEGEARGDRLF